MFVLLDDKVRYRLGTAAVSSLGRLNALSFLLVPVRMRALPIPRFADYTFKWHSPGLGYFDGASGVAQAQLR